MRILVDRSVVEIYADGRETMSLRTHPPQGQDALQLHIEKGPLTLTRLKAWEMKPIEWE